MTGREDKKAAARALRLEVEAKLRWQSNSQAAWCTLFLVCCQAVWLVTLLGLREVFRMNAVPWIAHSVSLALRCLILVITWQVQPRGACLWLNQQVCHGLTLCLDGVFVSVANPEVQYYLYQLIPWLQNLGKSPFCGNDKLFASKTDDRCAMPVEMYQSILLLLGLSAFYTIFILRFRHAIWATSFSFAAFQVMHIIALGPTIHAKFEVMNAPGPLVLLVIFLIAKRKIESGLQQLFVELIEKQREVVDEKVKRCRAEFESELAVARHDAGSVAATSVRGSDTASSGAAFHLERRCKEEDDLSPLNELHRMAPLNELHRMAGWGRREHWLLDPLHLAIHPGSVLGKGGFGTVFSGYLAGSPVAVKLARLHGVALQIQELANELRVIRHVRHPNIAVFFGACFEPALGVFGLVLELVEGTRLDDYVRSSCAQVASPTVWSIFLDINRALSYLHSRDPAISHGDVKPSNIMLEEARFDMRAKLLDFGLSRILSPQAQCLGGTPVWMAPEVGAGCAPSTSADVYSYGMVVVFVVTGQRPRQGHLSWPNSCFSQICKRLAGRCLKQSPESRACMEEVRRILLAWPGDLGWHRSLTRSFLGMPWAEALKHLSGSEEDRTLCLELQTVTLRQKITSHSCQEDSDQSDLDHCGQTSADQDNRPELGAIGAAGHMMAL